MVKIPKKYQDAIKEVYETDSGWMAKLNEGWYWGVDACTVLHEDTMSELIKAMRDIHKHTPY